MIIRIHCVDDVEQCQAALGLDGSCLDLGQDNGFIYELTKGPGVCSVAVQDHQAVVPLPLQLDDPDPEANRARLVSLVQILRHSKVKAP